MIYADYHGTEGPLPVDTMASTLLADKFILAGQELGYEHVDISGKNQLGKDCWMHNDHLMSSSFMIVCTGQVEKIAELLKYQIYWQIIC
jgi:hypothetical protein